MTIGYNILNLPKTITKSSDNIAYIYSAAGEKLAKKMIDNTYQYYAGNMVYKNDKSLNYLLFEEGLVNKVSGGYTYEYHLKDHLGNTRVTFQPNGSGTTTTQVAEYYPFGSTYSPISPAGTNKYLYNGKEKQDDVLNSTALDEYDYGARFYDPNIGRFHTVDLHAENYSSWSPYHYASNNPMVVIDPDGNDWYQTNDGKATKWVKGSDDIEGYKNLGSTYTQNIGDGMSIKYDQNNPVELTEKVLETGDFSSQRKADGSGKEGDEGSCFYQSGKMVEKSGAQSLGGDNNGEKDSQKGVDYLNSQVDQGKSARVQVDRFKDGEVGDGKGDHWVAISSRTTDLKTQKVTKFGFFDPGAAQQGKGTDNYFNVGTDYSMNGKPSYNRTFNYHVVQVRKNKN